MPESSGPRQPLPQQLPLPDEFTLPKKPSSPEPSLELPSVLTTPLVSTALGDLQPLPAIPQNQQPAAPPPELWRLIQKRMDRLEEQLQSQAQLLQSLKSQPPTQVAAQGHLPADSDFSVHIDLNSPRPPELNFGIDDLLRVVVNYNASDLHVKALAPPTVRLNGDLVPIGERALTEAEALYLVMSSVPPEKRARLTRLREIDHAYVSSGVRFRMNAFLERGRVSAAYRMINANVPNFEALGLPPVLARLANLHNGLVLVTGPAGSGKSTTLASVVDWINRNRRAHVVTIEDPIEYYHSDIHSFISQREVGTDTASFPEALRQALRQDPNVIMVGEMRDIDTILTAVTAAETGHLVLSTLHTPNTVQSIDRILDTFSGDQQKQIRMLLSSCLRGVVSQKLLQRVDGKGRIPAVEVLVCTSTIQSLILEGNTKEIYTFIQQGGNDGMQTFTSSLTRLLEQGLVTREEAMFHADQTTELTLATRHTLPARSSDSISGRNDTGRGDGPRGSSLNWM